jgi:metal-sulfur cluster biosynthetic enzyme
MTLTAPNCPVADSLVENVRQAVAAVDGVASVDLELTFEPPWDREMLSEEAKLELGLLSICTKQIPRRPYGLARNDIHS